MFLQQAMNPWFAVQRASQVTMLLLAVAMLFIPVLTQPKQGEAAVVAICIACGIVLASICYVCLDAYINRCRGPCGGWYIGTDHDRECAAGHSYYWCGTNEGWLHAACTSS